MTVDPVSISRSALDVEWQRMQVAALNLANQNSVSAPGQDGYRPLTMISGPAGGFNQALAAGTRVVAIRARSDAVRRVHDPRHPMADNAGYVTYPNIDQAEETVALMRAARAYESNLTALSLSQQMAMRALDIGRR